MAIKYNGTNVTNPVYNRTALNKVIYNGTVVFHRTMKIYTNGTSNVSFFNDYDTNWDTNPSGSYIIAYDYYIQLFANNWYGRSCGTSSPIDLSPFNYLKLEYSTTENSTKKTLSYNISSVSGNKYIWIRISQYYGEILLGLGIASSKSDKENLCVEAKPNCTTLVHRIWLE